MDAAKIINYSDKFYSCSSNDETEYNRMVRDHLLVYVYSGELVLEEENDKIIIEKGQCVFIRRNHRAKIRKQPTTGDPFRVIILAFRRKFLRDFYYKMDKKIIPLKAGERMPGIVKICPRPDVTSLFLSLTPYFDTRIQPSPEIMNLKEQEGVYILLKTDSSFYPCLFDFTEAWKIDIMDFLNENYMYGFSLKEISAFTGRSPATFKKDFKKLSDLPPRKWLIQRRLEAAYDKLYEQSEKASDVYMEVGFKNLSHFYFAFKKKYGFSPGKQPLK